MHQHNLNFNHWNRRIPVFCMYSMNIPQRYVIRSLKSKDRQYVTMVSYTMIYWYKNVFAIVGLGITSNTNRKHWAIYLRSDECYSTLVSLLITWSVWPIFDSYFLLWLHEKVTPFWHLVQILAAMFEE
jgi:hypothetical protein